jgi:site-specific DNA-methyltransferase (adenine-specific)
MLINASRSRDILECIASLSSDEVATPPVVANQVLDLLPAEVWSNKDLRWLDPACKTGVFLREAARRLMEGLKDSIPDEAERRRHIFTKMLHGYAITELTAQISRRSTYYNKDASNQELSVVPFSSPEGNIWFSGDDHSYNADSKCGVCGAGQEAFGAPGNRERHAYDFIHKPGDSMKFDVIVGNPPYQLDAAGFGRQATPIYDLFVEQAIRLQPRYIAMIIPSRWFTGGMGLSQFRDKMLNTRHLKSIHDFANSEWLFPGVQVKGGVCYFLWDNSWGGACEFNEMNETQIVTSEVRDLSEHGDILVRHSKARGIIAKVTQKSHAMHLSMFTEHMSGLNPFGIPSNFAGGTKSLGSESVNLHTKDGVLTVNRDTVVSNRHLLEKWKVFLSKAGPNGAGYPNKILGRVFVDGPSSACTHSYFIAATCSSKEEASRIAMYLHQRLPRFLAAMRMATQDISRERFLWVPYPTSEVPVTDEELYAFFDITSEESDYIDSLVTRMESLDF